MFNIKDVNEHLDSDEKVLKFFRPSRLAYLLEYISHSGVMIIAFILVLGHFPPFWTDIFTWLSIVLLVYSVVSLVILEYKIISRRYALTTERLIYSKGIFSDTFRSSPYHKVTDIGFHQSFWDKLMNTGTLSINTAGTDNFEIRYRKVRHPHDIKKLINDRQPTQPMNVHVKKKK